MNQALFLTYAIIVLLNHISKQIDTNIVVICAGLMLIAMVISNKK
jgi:hypothetical protein